MAIRDYQFIVGAETSTLPAAGTPSGDGDTITKGYADDHYVQGGLPVADLTALAAIAGADRADGDVLLVKSSNTLYRFDSASSATADGTRIVAPAVGTGRWFIIRPGQTALTGDEVVDRDLTVNRNLTVTGDMTVNGTTTTLNTATLDVEDANVTVNKGGTASTANTNVAGLTVEASGGTAARIGYDSTKASFFKAGATGSESELVTTATNQTFTGDKIFDTAPTLKELASTPATPSTGYQRLYPKTDGKFYKLDDAGIEQAIGTGAGGGSINFILNPDAETDTAGWSTYADAAGTTPVDGTGGSPNVTWTRSTSSPLRGTASFLFTKDAANRQGQGVSYAFTIDSADVSKTLQISFDFDGSLTGYAAGDLTAYIYDVTNSVLITPAAVSLAQAKYQFQTTFVASTSTSYRLILHVASTSTTAYTAKFDNIVVGPQILTLGTTVGPRFSWSPTVSGFTSATTEMFYQQVGTNILIQGKISGSSASATELYFTLPAGMTIVPPSSPATYPFGQAVASRNGAYMVASEACVLIYKSGEPNKVYLSNTNNGSGDFTYLNGSVAFGAASNRTITIHGVVPINEFSGGGVYLSTAQPEYVFSTSTTTTAGASVTTGFGSGPQGVNFNAIASTTDSSITTYRVQFLTPIQPTDKIEIQFSRDRINWTKLGDDTTVQSAGFQNTKNYGMGLLRVSGSTNTMDVYFGNNGRAATGSTFAANGGVWSDVTSFYWRVVKIPGQVQVATPAQAPISEIIVSGGSGHGSTNTLIRRFTSLESSAGSDVTWTSSATLGDTFTINARGKYAITYQDQRTLGQGLIGLSVNDTQLSTGIKSTNAPNILGYAATDSANEAGNLCVVRGFNAGDIIRCKTDSLPNETDSKAVRIIITQVAKY